MSDRKRSAAERSLDAWGHEVAIPAVADAVLKSEVDALNEKHKGKSVKAFVRGIAKDIRRQRKKAK
jgi:hypothetical protein